MYYRWNVVVFDNKKIFLFAGYLLNYALIPYMGYLQKHTLRDKLVAASHFLAQVAKDFFLPGHKGVDLVLGLTVISVEGSMSNSFRLCVA